MVVDREPMRERWGPTAPPGFDPMAQGAKRSVFWVPSFKACRPGSPGDPKAFDPVVVATSFNELLVALQLEFDPRVACYGRADLADMDRLARLAAFHGRPLRIPFSWEGKTHFYLPDYAGFLTDGRPFLAEAGDDIAKSSDEAKAHLRAGLDWITTRMKGVFWFGGQGQLSKRRLLDALQFHLARFSYQGSGELVERVRAVLASERTTLRALRLFLPDDDPDAVDHAALVVLGEANAAGRLHLPPREMFDLDSVIDLRPRAAKDLAA